MAAIVWADVTERAPELAAVGLLAQTDYLAFVNVELNVTMFGGEDAPKLKSARIYLAAHMATLDRQRGSAIAGPVISESRGGLSRSYANMLLPGSGGGLWAQTTYGQLYYALVRTSARARFPTVA